MSASQFHPEAIARGHAHDAREPGSCASDRPRKPPMPCDCRPDPEELAAIWAGRARMARARLAAGGIFTPGSVDPDYEPASPRVDGLSWARTCVWTDQPLDDIDRQALERVR